MLSYFSLFIRKFIHLTLDSGLIEACRMLIDNRIHRLPVIDPETGDLFAILNQKPLLKFLFNIPKVRTLTGLSESIEEAGVGSYDNISVGLPLLLRVYIYSLSLVAITPCHASEFVDAIYSTASQGCLHTFCCSLLRLELFKEDPHLFFRTKFHTS